MRKIKNYGIAVIACILLGLTVCGSFFDYKIVNAVYLGQKPSENFFGIVFSFIGIIPTFVGWSFLGASILYLSKKYCNNRAKRRWLIALSVLLFLLSFFFFCNTLMMVNKNAFSVHWAIAYPIGIVVLLCATYLGYKLSARSTNTELLKRVVFLSFVSLLLMLIVMTTKGIMDRPRFRFVLDSANPEYFRNWWQTGSSIKSSLATGIASDEFSSFPSGHSAYAMFAIFLFPALAEYLPKLGKHKKALFVGGFLWWGLVAFSRLTVGAHYLTDVCIAGLVSLFSYGIVKLLWDVVVRKKAIANAPSGVTIQEENV